MLKRTLTILSVFVFFVGISYSQLKPEKAIKVDPNFVPEVNISTSSPVNSYRPASEQLIFTNYDYAGNNSIPNMLYMYDFTADGKKDVVATAMQRFGTTRNVRLIVGNLEDGFTDFTVSHAVGAGWGTLQVGEEGPWNNQAVVFYHQGGNTWFSTTDMTTLTPTVPTANTITGNFPSFVYKNATGEVYLTNTNGELFKSTDQTNFTTTGVFFDPTGYNITDNNSEYILKSSPNGQYLVHVGAWAVSGNGGPGGADPDSADFVGYNYSTDGGNTWSFELIGRDGITAVFNRSGYYPIFENFGQLNFAVDNNGVVHVGMNGYAFHITPTDTGFAFPALYWNSRDKKWLAVSDPVVEIDIDTNPSQPVANRNGNGIGNAYVVPSISPDGSKIVMLWQGPEYSGGQGISAINQWTPTGASPLPIIYTDLLYSYSVDGGVTWSAPALVPNASSQLVAECYPSPNNYLEIVSAEADSMVVNFLYMIDAIPGGSIFSTPQNEPSDNCSWNYERFSIPLPAVTTVDVTFAVDMGVQAFKGLFNPATDLVKLAGNFNGWNNGADVMTDTDGDTVYTITKQFNPGENLEFKFIKGVDGWENIPNRTYTVPSSNSTYSAWFDNDSNYVLLTPVNFTFKCNMEFEIFSGRFNPATDTLSVRGSFNGWSNTWVMAPGGDPNVYEVTNSYNTFAGEVLNYKFAYITGSGTNWESGSDRQYTVTAANITSGSALIERTFNDLTLANVTNQPCTIKFTVNMTGAISAINLQPLAPVTDVRLCGANPPLKWPAGGWPNEDSVLTIKMYDDGTNGDLVAGDNIWSRDVTFPQYSPLDVEYKYGANWGLPTNQGGNDNENGVGANHWIHLLPNMLSATVENVFGTMATQANPHPLVNVVLGIANELPGIPETYDLAQNFPNPFNPSTSIRFSIPEAGLVTLKVYNTLGEEVATVLNEFKNAGNYEVSFDASKLTSGVYIYKITSGNFTATKKMMLMK